MLDMQHFKSTGTFLVEWLSASAGSQDGRAEAERASASVPVLSEPAPEDTLGTHGPSSGSTEPRVVSWGTFGALRIPGKLTGDWGGGVQGVRSGTLGPRPLLQKNGSAFSSHAQLHRTSSPKHVLL